MDVDSVTSEEVSQFLALPRRLHFSASVVKNSWTDFHRRDMNYKKTLAIV